jgi:predicted nucleotidyltransferase
MTKELRIPADELNLLRAFQRHEIPFVIIGGHAVRFHGVDREVEDLDVFVDSAGRDEALRAALIEVFGYSPIIPGVVYEEIPLKRIGLNIEILMWVQGVKFAEAYRAAHEVKVEGVTVRVISKEHLIRNKRAVGREKDLQDVERLEALASL